MSGLSRMSYPNPGLQITIPQVNEEALLQEPMNNNGMSVNSQATIENSAMYNNSNSENGLSVYDEMEGGRKRKHRHTKKCKCKKVTRKAKKLTRKAKKLSRKAKKLGRGSRK